MLLVELLDLPPFIFLLSFNYHFWVSLDTTPVTGQSDGGDKTGDKKGGKRVSLLKTKTSLETGGVGLTGLPRPDHDSLTVSINNKIFIRNNLELSPALSSRYSDVGEGLSGESKMTLHILTDDGFLVVTGNIVPLDAWANSIE